MVTNIHRSFVSVAACLGSLFAGGLALGQVVAVPTDLSPGDSYRLLLVTDGTIDATSSDVAVYNAFVTSEAAAAPELDALGTTWTAVVSTAVVDARDNTSTNPTPSGDTGVPIYLVDGTRFADHYDALWAPGGPMVGGTSIPDGTLANIPSASGGLAPNVRHWTGTGPLGTVLTPLGDPTPRLGVNRDDTWLFPSFRWVSFSSNATSADPFPMLAMSDVLTVPSTSFCDASDGSLASCPCGNPGNPDTGCDVAQGTGGVRLDLVAQETSPQNRVTFSGTGFPAATTPAAVVIRASGLDPSAPVVFGDGLRCIGTPLVRLGASFAAGGTSTHTFGHGAGAGSGAFDYQLWFRNTPAMYCDPAAAFNLSNGRTLEW